MLILNYEIYSQSAKSENIKLTRNEGLVDNKPYKSTPL